MFGYLLIFISIWTAVLTQVALEGSIPEKLDSPDESVYDMPLGSKFFYYPKDMVMDVPETTLNLQDDENGEFVLGTRGSCDQLLLRTTVFKKPKYGSPYVRKIVTFPSINNVKVKVTQVVAHDKGFSKGGGNIKVIEGGIGKDTITLSFTSLRNTPIHYVLEIYGTVKL